MRWNRRDEPPPLEPLDTGNLSRDLMKLTLNTEAMTMGGSCQEARSL